MPEQDTTTAAGTLAPLESPPEDRPLLPSQPCEACGSLLDPLRAPLVLAFEDGYRFLCGRDCERDFRLGARQRRAPTPVSQRAVTPVLTPSRMPSVRPIPLAAAPAPEHVARGVWYGAAAVLAAMIVGVMASTPGFALAAALLCCVAAACALAATRPLVADAGWLTWGAGPVGAALAALAAQHAVEAGHGSWLGVEGAALAAAAVVARAWLDRRAREPLERALTDLVKLPARVHVPVASTTDPLAMSMQLAEAQAVRTGEEIIAMRGETLAVDGVVQAGEASVRPYPGATTPLRRAAGDPMLAGAVVVDGAVRVLATRVGDERSLVRLARLASERDRQPAPLARAIDVVTRFGGGGAVVLAIAAALLVKDSGAAAPVAAASAVLLAAPLLALRRAAVSPLRAAAAMAGARGIVYHSAAALDRLGRVTTVALSPHGVLTEAWPVVVEFHVLDGSNADGLIAMASAAENAAGEHPIARALALFAADRSIADVEVRRPVHHPGKGVTAISPQGQPLVIGSRRLLLEEGISVAVADAEAAHAEAAARTPIFIALDGRVRAVMTLHYELRVGTRAAVQRMFDLGLEVVLLTGDQRGAVQAIASGIDVEHVKAELLPEERGQQVRSLRDAGGVVAALGRPGEDDAALAAADAGVLLGAAGGSATERAVALVGDDVRDAAAALWIARAARDTSFRGVSVAGVAFGLVVAAAAAALIVPGVAALFAVAVDAYCLPTGARLLQRIGRRLPARS